MKKIKQLISGHSTVWVFVLIILTFILTYFKVPSIFFQQDEWLGFGLIIAQGKDIILRGLGSDQIYHFIPIDNFMNYFMFKTFGLNNTAFNLVGLAFHLINSLMVYTVAYSFFNKKKFALLSSILFLTSSAADQLIMWPLVSLNTLSLTFALVVWWLINIYRTKVKPVWWGVMIALLTIASALTVEYAIGLFLFVVLSDIYYQKRIGKKLNVKSLTPLLVSSVFYFGIRALPYLHNNKVNNSGVASHGVQTLLPFLLKIVSYPPRYLGQLLIPDKQISLLGQYLASYSSSISELELSKILGFVIGTLVIIGLIFVFIKVRQRTKSIPDWAIISGLFAIAAILPFIFIPGDAGNFYLFPPRYMYFGLAGFSIFLSGILQLLIRFKKLYLILFGLVLVYIMLGIANNWIYQNDLINESVQRQAILSQIKMDYPLLYHQTVFYTDSDSSYYGLLPDDKILPFQSGFGQTLLIWYYPIKGLPAQAYGDRFLWDIKSQGYRELNGVGFGYFRDFNLLKETVVKNNIPPDSVISYSWHSTTGILENTTLQTRKMLGK